VVLGRWISNMMSDQQFYLFLHHHSGTCRGRTSLQRLWVTG